MSETNNNPPGGTPSPGFQKGLIIPAPSNLRPSHLSLGTRPDAEPQQRITLQFVLTAMRQWWKWATPIGLVLAVIFGTLIYFLFEPVYEATAWLRIEDTRPYIAFPDSGSSKTFIDTQVQLIRSPLVLAPVLSQPKIASIPKIKELEESKER